MIISGLGFGNGSRWFIKTINLFFSWFQDLKQLIVDHQFNKSGTVQIINIHNIWDQQLYQGINGKVGVAFSEVQIWIECGHPSWLIGYVTNSYFMLMRPYINLFAKRKGFK